MNEKPNGKRLDPVDVAIEAADLLRYLKEKEMSPQMIITTCQTTASIMTNVLSMEALMVSMAGMFGGKR